MNRPISAIAAASTAALLLTACSGAEESAPAPEASATMDAPMSASAMLKDRDGADVGTVTATQEGELLKVSLSVNGMPSGTHGVHIHTTGDCSAADFTSAGGHWNPGETNHGTESEAPNPHAGDLPNLEVAEDGTGSLEAESSGTFEGLMDDDGSAFIVHAGADDYKSQPSGDAGERIACGVFAADG